MVTPAWYVAAPVTHRHMCCCRVLQPKITYRPLLTAGPQVIFRSMHCGISPGHYMRRLYTVESYTSCQVCTVVTHRLMCCCRARSSEATACTVLCLHDHLITVSIYFQASGLTCDSVTVGGVGFQIRCSMPTGLVSMPFSTSGCQVLLTSQLECSWSSFGWFPRFAYTQKIFLHFKECIIECD